MENNDVLNNDPVHLRATYTATVCLYQHICLSLSSQLSLEQLFLMCALARVLVAFLQKINSSPSKQTRTTVFALGFSFLRGDKIVFHFGKYSYSISAKKNR
jgi:hypothetical protein